MPRPLLSIDPHAGFGFGPHVLIQRPGIALIIAEIITSWAIVEVRQLELFMEMIGRRNKLAASMFLSLQSRGTKSDAITSIAEHSGLTKTQLEVFRALIALSKSWAKERDRVAHWLVATPVMSRDIPEIASAIVLAHPTVMALGASRAAKKDILVFTEPEMRKIADNNRRLEQYYWEFARIIKSKDPKERRKRLAELSAAPEIREALNRLANKGRSPASEGE